MYPMLGTAALRHHSRFTKSAKVASQTKRGKDAEFKMDFVFAVLDVTLNIDYTTREECRKALRACSSEVCEQPTPIQVDVLMYVRDLRVKTGVLVSKHPLNQVFGVDVKVRDIMETAVKMGAQLQILLLKKRKAFLMNV
ncbi:unnamed protein product [Timema podura]|uniref:Uncharacterized protein n=1 Tax=Timema podura TaxID=61482 RepID=A0ABN7NQ19_TIMPD|nr:unnamed protein product [Timema podura]